MSNCLSAFQKPLRQALVLASLSGLTLILAGCGGGTAASIGGPGSAPTGATSKWVYYNTGGQLAYMPLNTQGDQIMDFSTAGYGGGGVTIPTATVAATVNPSGGDDTANIQAAINTVSALPLNSTTGLRGAVSLGAGNFIVSNSLTISASGVVLRGSGNTTVITMTAETTPYPLVVIAGSGSPVVAGTPTAITDSYVPAGTLTLHVASTAGLAVGTNIEIHRPVTTNWVHFMGMDTLVLNGTPETWLAVGDTSLRTQRTITAINGLQITLDAPMSDSIDSTYENPPGGTLNAYTFAGRITNVGVESFRAIAPAVIGVPDTPSYQLVSATQTMNSWVRNLSAQDTLASVYIGTDCKQVTVSNISITHTVTQSGTGARFYEYYADSATQVLYDTVSSTGNNLTFFGTSSATQGPTVVRNSTFNGTGNVEPHQRWATGLLIENTTVTGSGEIHLIDRGTDGSGHGWAIGWGVIWNSTADTFIIQHPPGAENWCIGCIGAHMEEAPPGSSTVLTEGHFDSSGTQVTPASLYQAQLSQRLGIPY